MPDMQSPYMRRHNEPSDGTKNTTNRVGADIMELVRSGREVSVKIVGNSHVVDSFIEINTGKRYKATFTLHHYPFEPPLVRIDDKPYSHYYMHISNNVNHKYASELHEGTIVRGPLTKVINWFPGCDLFNLSLEIKYVIEKNIEYHRKKIQKYYCRKICNAYLVRDIPLEDHL